MDGTIKKSLLVLWNNIFNVKIAITESTYQIFDNIIRLFIKPPIILNTDITIDEIIQKGSSISRYGDGEYKLINKKNITFQRTDDVLSRRLKEILRNRDENFLVCIPDVFQSLSKYENETRVYWSKHTARNRIGWYKLLIKNKEYHNSFISRFYNPYKDKSKCEESILNFRSIWEDREVVLIEGRKSRLGVGNDLFNNTKSLERILVPEENAFFVYDKIISIVKSIPTTKLILLAAGPTATVLAYDLFKKGYQAIDIGHIDIEYEWYLRKANKKIEIQNKYVCEAGAGKGIGELKDEKYQSEIIAEVSQYT
ncbi:SP_1767 family glycosyltransferase [Robertmurraya sp. GLU-23]